MNRFIEIASEAEWKVHSQAVKHADVVETLRYLDNTRRRNEILKIRMVPSEITRKIKTFYVYADRRYMRINIRRGPDFILVRKVGER